MNERENYRKTWLFSHNDLDGYSCNVVARAFLNGYTGKIVEMNCDYSKIDSEIRSRMPEIDTENDLVIVSDISWDKSSNDITEFMKSIPDGNLIIADHHRSSEWIGQEIDRNSVITIEAERCGCEILKDILESMLFYVQKGTLVELVKFTSVVSDWDLWKWADTSNARSTSSIGNLLYMDAPRLSTWFEWCLETGSGSKFVDTVIEKLYDQDVSLAAGIEDEFKDKRFQEHMKNVRDTLYDSAHQYYRFKILGCLPALDAMLFVLPKGFQHKSLLSMIAERRLKEKGVKDYDCIAIWVDGDSNISLRYPQNGIDFSKVLKTCAWGGGGHKEQAGTNPGAGYMSSFCSNNKLWRF